MSMFSPKLVSTAVIAAIIMLGPFMEVNKYAYSGMDFLPATGDISLVHRLL